MSDAVSAPFQSRDGAAGAPGHAMAAGSAAAREARLVLAGRGWLAGCPPAFADAVLDAAAIVDVPRGYVILDRREPGHGLCGLAAGALAVTLSGLEGGPTRLHLGAPGLWLGESALLGETTHPLDVTASTDSRLAWLAAEDIARLADVYPETWRHLGRLAAMNATSALASASCLLTRDSTARVARKLLQVDPGDVPFVSLTQTALAEMVGLSRNTLNRALAMLKRVGALHIGYAHIQVRDRAKLAQVARFGPAAEFRSGGRNERAGRG